VYTSNVLLHITRSTSFLSRYTFIPCHECECNKKRLRSYEIRTIALNFTTYNMTILSSAFYSIHGSVLTKSLNVNLSLYIVLT